MKEYISIDLLKMAIEAEPYFTDSTKSAFRNIVNKVPAADVVERKRGEWIERPFLLGTSNFCSLCDSFYGMPHGKFNFCPNCGADMREVDHD